MPIALLQILVTALMHVDYSDAVEVILGVYRSQRVSLAIWRGEMPSSN